MQCRVLSITRRVKIQQVLVMGAVNATENLPTMMLVQIQVTECPEAHHLSIVILTITEIVQAITFAKMATREHKIDMMTTDKVGTKEGISKRETTISLADNVGMGTQITTSSLPQRRESERKPR